MRFGLLGNLRVEADGLDLAPVRPKQRALLALLLVRAGEIVPADECLEVLWGERPPATARKALQGHVSALRKQLGAGRIETQGLGYVLRLAPNDEFDLHELERAVAESRERDPWSRASQLRDALALFRGEPLADFRYESFAARESDRLEELRLNALEEWIEAELELGHHLNVLGDLGHLIDSQPFRERPRGQLALALYRGGRQSESLQLLSDTRRLLASELGVDPGPALQQLERRILAHDPSLLVTADSRPPSPHEPSGTVTSLVAPPIPDQALVGRELELARLERLIDRPPDDRAAALVLEGEAGIGKSAVWQSAVATARERGLHVLVTRPSEPERSLSFAALADLFDGKHHVIDALPAAQRRPLAVALLLEEPDGPAPDRREIGAALLATLRAMLHDRPLLVAIDDVQWLDPSSAAALAFALRRLSDAPVRVLMTERTGSGSDVGLTRELEHDLPLERLSLGPLSLGAIRRLLQVRLGASFPRPILRRIYEHAGGSPFFTLELARGLQAQDGVLSPADELPLPRDLERLLAMRLERLPPATKEPLAAVAALAEPTLDLLQEELLEPAFADGVLVVERGRIRFAHPLLATVAYRRLGPQARRRLHQQLGERVRNPEERARHLALGADGPDAAVAAALDAAAAQARARGAPEAAMELAQHALALTPPEDEEGAVLRRARAAEYATLGGDDRHARQLLEEGLAGGVAGPPRARLLQWLAYVEGGDVERGTTHMREAIAHARGDDALEADLTATLARRLHRSPREALPYARSALEVAERVGDQVVLANALCALATTEFIAGNGHRLDLWQRALELDPECEALPIDTRPITRLGSVSRWAGDIDRSRTLLERACAIGYERGDSAVSVPLLFCCDLELLADNWQHGLELVDEVLELGRQAERPDDLVSAYCEAAAIHAHLGNEAESRHYVVEARQLGDRAWWQTTRVTSAALSMLELSLDHPAEAFAEAQRAMITDRDRGIEEPGMLFSFPIEIEAAIALGDLEEAERLLDWIWERAVRLDREWALACAARGRGLLAAARGDEEAAAAAFARALAEHGRVQYRRFDLARTLLAQGEALRRFKKRRAAREAIESARDLFDELGAKLWSAKAARELARVAGRRSSSGLTETERRVAALVASGKSNKEVASELFVTAHTVEATLTRIYEKLGVRSRTELASRLPDPNM